VVAGLVPGDVGTLLPAVDRDRSAKPAPSGRTVPSSTASVDMSWVPRAKRALAQVNGDLARLGKAERAAAGVPRAQWSARLHALMGLLERRKADLLRERALLRADLSLVETYGRAAKGLVDARRQLGLLNQARGSLQGLSGAAREQLGWILNGLESQAGRLSHQEETHRNAEESLRTPAVRASSRPLPDLAGDVDSLVDEVDEAAADSASPHPRPGGDAPRSDRPPAAPHSPPGRPTHTAAPPHPHPSSPPASKNPADKNPADEGSPPAAQPPASGGTTPIRPRPPAAQPPAAIGPGTTLNDGGGGGSSDSTAGFGTDSDSTGSDVGSDAGADAGADASADSGSDAGADSGSDGSDGSDGGGDSGF
jgi:hypothetical protein